MATAVSFGPPNSQDSDGGAKHQKSVEACTDLYKF